MSLSVADHHSAGKEIETWVQALAHYDNNEFDESLKVFGNIADTSKILFNCGVIHATLGEHDKAVERYQRAISLDNYLAVAYFQEGVSNFLLGDFEEALANFNDTLLYLRGNTSIDYEQLGLKFRLFSCEVLFNRGLSYIYLQQMQPGMQDLQFASKEKVTADHDVIDEAIREQAEGYTVFSIPVGVIYRPNEAKVKNLKTKDYLGKARLVAASDRNNAFTGFQGSELKKALALEATAKDDRPPESISYAATNLVQKNLSSRSRQQSEPPLNRNTFPPTPPPESDRTAAGGGLTQRAASVRSGRPPRLDLTAGTNGRTGGDMPSMEKTRIGTTRTASEPRGPHSRQYSLSSRARDVRPRLYRDMAGSRRSEFDFVPEEGYDGEVFDMYRNSSRLSGLGLRTRPQQQQQQQQPKYIDEEAEYASDYEDEAVDEFEMVGEATATATTASTSNRRRTQSRRPAEIRRFRVKVHALEDTRYIMIEANTAFGEFEGKIREKFGFRGFLRIRMRDDNDMITMGDQEDLDLLLGTARDEARRENQEMGKMEARDAKPELGNANVVSDVDIFGLNAETSIALFSQRQPRHKRSLMTDLTSSVHDLLREKHNVRAPATDVPRGDQTVNEFLKEAHRINTHIQSLLQYLKSTRQSYLAISTSSSKKAAVAATSTTATPHNTSNLPTNTKNLTDQDRDNIDSSTALLLRDLSASISNLQSAETLRQETESRLLRKKYGRPEGVLWRWAAGGGSSGSNNANDDRSAEQITAEESANTIRAVRESILWFLRRGLENVAEVQRGMVEKRIERAREKEKSVLYKTKEQVAARRISGEPGTKEEKQTQKAYESATMLSAEEAAAIESQLSPEQLQLFAEENDTMIRHYEDTLSKVQNAEKSLLEISSLQQSLVSHLSTQEEYISQLVSDASTTSENVGKGNKELKRANERKSTAQMVFWATAGLCAWLVVWDAVF
ncbi:hypothetical protein UA08_02577 [Talaromyces atroroseus]|uniref:t-SNARE coiled-coil homology domain-containing protein n=1 Tax=Talaromyces atroroseus TaxID=1441469 RepID=A0A225ANI6_TALAT|nr:hypothetical protein UA08_02577 [Talaromyces atroroseus]OKL62450.1 hypothetical protein UA08_02577 [Talaromyces atroroseus]